LTNERKGKQDQVCAEEWDMRKFDQVLMTGISKSRNAKRIKRKVIEEIRVE
jgi:hypothetical protein